MSKSRWTQKLVTKRKKSIKDELDAIGSAKGEKAKLRHINSRINELSDDHDSDSQLKCFIYIVSSLVHHERNGGLSTSQIEQAAKLGHAILRVQGISPTTSHLSFLYGELHLVLSQLYRRQGDNLKALWEQQLSLQLAKCCPPGGHAFQSLSLGLRTLRIGQTGAARKYLLDAINSEELPDESLEIAYLSLVKSLRLCGRLDSASQWLKKYESIRDPSRHARLELEWEKICINATKTDDLTEMLETVRRGSDHYRMTYVAEAYLWALSHSKEKMRAQMPAIRTLVKNKVFDPKKMGFLFKSIKKMLDCYDTSYPYTVRLRNLGDVLFNLQLMPSVDLELLGWLAATRWLMRNSSLDLASFTLREYKALSLRLSHNNDDVLGIASDLKDRSWYKEREGDHIFADFSPCKTVA